MIVWEARDRIMTGSVLFLDDGCEDIGPLICSEVGFDMSTVCGLCRDWCFQI